MKKMVQIIKKIFLALQNEHNLKLSVKKYFGGNIMHLAELVFKRAEKNNIPLILNIIHRCLNEVNYIDLCTIELQKYLKDFNTEWLSEVITKRHYYEVWYRCQIIACGGVSKDLTQDSQSYITAIFVNPDYHGKGVGTSLITFIENDEWCLDSEIIEIPSSKSSHKFYHKLGYEYRSYPPVFNKKDGSTIMYKYR